MRRLMGHRWTNIWAAGAAAVMIAACAERGALTDHLTTGETFPVLSVNDLEGKAAAWSAESGKLTVLNVWATWCAPCRKELPSLQRLSQDLDAQRFRVVGLSLDDDAHDVREYLIDKGVTFANYMDPEHHVADNVLGVKAYPYTFFIGPGGEVLGRVVGTAVWDDAKVITALEAAYRGDSTALADISRR